MKQYFWPYLEAVQSVMSGTAVENLDTIRVQCNAEFLANNPDYNAGSNFNLELGALTFLADAENNILLGQEPADAYSGFTLPVEQMRPRALGLIEEVLEYNFY